MTCDATERDEVIAYYQVVIRDIADAKARFWRFMVVLIAITGALIGIHISEFTTKLLLVGGHLLAAFSSMFITFDTDRHLEHSRDILDRIYEQWREVKTIRDPKGKNPVKERDKGDWFFFAIGIIAPALSAAIVVVHYFDRVDLAAFFATYLPFLAHQIRGR